HIRYARRQVLATEQIPNFLRSQLFTGDICSGLHDLAEFYLQPARHDELVVALQQIGDSALPGLAVDSNDRVVRSAQIGRINGKVGDIPDIRVAARREALLNGVLMRS